MRKRKGDIEKRRKKSYLWREREGEQMEKKKCEERNCKDWKKLN